MLLMPPAVAPPLLLRQQFDDLRHIVTSVRVIHSVAECQSKGSVGELLGSTQHQATKGVCVCVCVLGVFILLSI